MKKKIQENQITKLKKKEVEVLYLLYRFRFLNRSQIQKMLGHKHHGQIQLWLNSLVEKGCIAKDYDKKFAGVPTTYYLEPPCRKYLKGYPHVNIELLDRRLWREKDRTEEFKEHCLFIADTYLSLSDFVTEVKSTLHYYSKTDLFGRDYIIEPASDAYFAIEPAKGNLKRYYLDLFGDIPPRAMRARIDQYLEYYDDDTWYEEYPDKPFPVIILVCPHKRLKGHLYKYIQNKLDEYPEEPEFFLTTRDTVKEIGLRKEALEKVVED